MIMQLQYDNPVLRQTMEQATKNICFFGHEDISSQTAIKDILPLTLAPNLFHLMPSFEPRYFETVILDTFTVYPDKSTNSIFSCFVKKRKKKQLVIYNRALGLISEEGELEVFINLNAVSVYIERGSRDITITVEASSREKQKTIYLNAESEEQKDKIDNILNTIQKSSQGAIQKLTSLPDISHYSEFLCISEEELRNTCDSGDLLLFKLKFPADSHMKHPSNIDIYQHIALIIRNKDNEILTIEKNKHGKVGVSYWINFLQRRWYRGLEKVVYRKLEIERTPQLLEKLEEWLIDTLEDQYHTDIRGLYKIPEKEGLLRVVEKRTYECCDLVTQCYNKIGILVINRQSIEFWPVDFTSMRELPLTNGKLGPEQLIAFPECASKTPLLGTIDPAPDDPLVGKPDPVESGVQTFK